MPSLSLDQEVVLHPARAQPVESNCPSVGASVATRTGIRCSGCPLRTVCMPPGLTPAAFEYLDAGIVNRRTIHQGAPLFRTHDSFQSIYAVLAGSFKTVALHRDGHEQLTGFRIPGDALGLDGVGAGRHICTAVALEDSKVCVIPVDVLESVGRQVPLMRHHIYRLMSDDIARRARLAVVLGTMTAQQRLAAFLLSVSARFRRRGYPADEFNVRMTREEIGNYLGIKLETVSRLFSKLKRTGIVDTHGKRVRIIDFDALAQI